MSIKNTVRLDIKWSISRGRETYGWNIVTITDTDTGKKYRTTGGGYDMQGTVLGDWVQDVLQDDLMRIKERAQSVYTDKRFQVIETNHTHLYGMTFYTNDNKVVLDGGCGENCIIRIIEACGYNIQFLRHGRKNEIVGYYIYPAE